jgi:hypothetical protein
LVEASTHSDSRPDTQKFAAAAEGREAGDDMVAGPDRGDVVADRLDHARRLMARQEGERRRIDAVDEMKVGMADAAGSGADQHLARTGRRHRDHFDGSSLPGWWRMAAFIHNSRHSSESWNLPVLCRSRKGK